MDNLPGNGTAWGGEGTRRNSRGAKSISTREIIETRGYKICGTEAGFTCIPQSMRNCVGFDRKREGREKGRGGIKFYRDTRG